MNPAITPFSCVASPNFSELLWELNCSIAITTYQAGKVVMISAINRDKIVQLPRTFERAMGINICKDKMIIGTANEVIVFRDSPNHAATYEGKLNTYDSLYLPRVVYKTGKIDMHDIHLNEDGTIYGVNTLFSCIVKLNSNSNFLPIWKPDFISELVPEDRCHLNGMIVIDGKPKYATALGQTNTGKGWKENIDKGGVLINVSTNEILMNNLAMPHSPVWHNGKILFLQSASGQVTEYDPKTGISQIIYETNKFIRGLSIHDEYMFIGLSKIRPNASFFRNLDITNSSTKSGIIVIHLPSKSLFANLNYNASVDEIYDICILPKRIRPNILNTETEKHNMAIACENQSYWIRDEKQQ